MRTYQAAAGRVDGRHADNRGRLGAPLHTGGGGCEIGPGSNGLRVGVEDADLGDRLRFCVHV